MIKPIRMKPIRTHFFMDTDRDGVSDFRDCQPFNPYAQEEEFVEEVKGAYKKLKSKLGDETKEKLEPIEKKFKPVVEGASEIEENIKEKAKEIGESIKEKYGETTFAKSRQYKKAIKEGEEAFKEMPIYLLVKIKEDKWYNWGEIPEKSITMAKLTLSQVVKQPGVEKAKLARDPAELKRLNLGILKENTKERIKKYGEKHGFSQSSLSTNVKSNLSFNPAGRAEMSRFSEGPGGAPPFSRYRPRQQPLDEFGQGEYQRPREIFGYSQRSPHYQEQSVFGPGVAPYRPMGRNQVNIGYDDIMAPNKPVTFPSVNPFGPSRPPGTISSARFKPITFKVAKIKFMRIGRW